MENNKLTPEKEKELLERAEKASTDIAGAVIEANEKEMSVTHATNSKTPSNERERSEGEIGE